MQPQKIEKIRYWMGSKLPRWVFDIAVFFRQTYKAIKMPEKRKKFGELNPDKTFYVIRLCPPATGFLANYNYVLGYMKYAYGKGWIPVVDMENYATLYQEEEPYNGTRNVWEYFFEQPYDPKTQKRYTLDEVYKSKNVVLGKADVQTMYDGSLQDDVLKWQYEMSLLVPFKKEMQEYIDKVAEISFPKGVKVLGVPTRGSDMKKRIIGHAIAMNAEEILPIVKQKCLEWNLDHVFVNAEEEETLAFFKKHLDKVYYTQCERIHNYDVNKDSSVALALESKTICRAESIKDYLANIKILSMCTSILGTKNNGLVAAVIWNGGNYEHVEVVDNGTWK